MTFSLFIIIFRHNLPVFVKQIGSKRVRIDEMVRTEAALMKETRHQNLVEFVGLILEPQRTFIVEGNYYLYYVSKEKMQLYLPPVCRILCQRLLSQCPR